VSQHFGTKNNVLHERMALFSVLTPFEEKRQDDYQVSQQKVRHVHIQCCILLPAAFSHSAACRAARFVVFTCQIYR